MPGQGKRTRPPAAGKPSGYRVPPPAADALIPWPDSFGTRFTVFVDTEEEFDWSEPFRREARSTTAIEALPEMHARFAERGVPVAYLVDHPVAMSPAAVAVLRRLLDDGCSTIGAQLHPWVNPPHDEPVSGPNSFTGNLPRALQAAKLRELTQAIDRAFGFRPLVYRAGRYGLGPDTLALLAAEGYRLDSSMRAAYDYSGEAGPDFSAIGNHAFFAGPERALVELPLTTVFTGRARRAGPGLHRALGRVPRGRGVAARLGLLSRVALTPEDMPLDEALEAVRIALGEGVRILNFSYHSPSLVPGHTPYVRDAAELTVFHRWWERMLDALDRHGVAPVSVEAVLKAADAARPAVACRKTGTSAIAGGAGGL